MLLLIGISWRAGRFVTGRTQTMPHVVDQLLRQMGRVGTSGVRICIVGFLMLMIFPQHSAAQLSGATVQDTKQKSLIKPVDQSLTPTVKKDGRMAKRAPHSLIRKSQSSLSATLQQPPLNTFESTSSSTAVSTSPQSDTTTQSSSLSSRTGTTATPSTASLSLMSTAASTTTTTATPNAIAPRSSSTGTTTFGGATIAAPSTSTSNGKSTLAPGRSMSSLAGQMPGLSQLMNPSSSSSSPPPLVPPAIAASPTSLSFTAQQGGSNPAAQTVSISNTGGGTLSWSADERRAREKGKPSPAT